MYLQDVIEDFDPPATLSYTDITLLNLRNFEVQMQTIKCNLFFEDEEKRGWVADICLPGGHCEFETKWKSRNIWEAGLRITILNENEASIMLDF